MLDLILSAAIVVAAIRTIEPLAASVSPHLRVHDARAAGARLATGLALLVHAERRRQGEGLADSPIAYLLVDNTVAVDTAVGAIWYLAIGCAWLGAFGALSRGAGAGARRDP